MPKRPRLTIVLARLDIDAIASSLRVSPSDALRKLQDPRVTSWFAEIWGEKLFGWRVHASSNHPGSDAAIGLGAIGRFDIAVRCCFAGTIKFQRSKFIGSGRSATQADLLASIGDVERIVLVDLRQLPNLRFIPLDPKPLQILANTGKLSPAGMRPAALDRWIDEHFDVRLMEVEL